MSEEGSSIWKLLSVVLIVSLICSCFVVYYSLNDKGLAVASESSFIDVSVEGLKKLGVNETGTYEAIVNSDVSEALEFVWSISPQDNMTVLSFDGAKAELTFVSATEEPYLLSVQVHDVERGNFGSGALTVYDPYTSGNLYLNSFGAPYSYLIEADGLGWYRAVNGLTGAISWSSTDATTVFQNAIDASNGKIFVAPGVYSGITKIIPKSDLWLCGSGYSTKLTQASSVNDDLFETTIGIDNFKVSDMRLSGNTAGNSAGNTFNLTTPRRCVFERLYLDDANGYHFFFAGASDATYGYYNTIKDCHEYSSDVGFLFTRWCDENTIQNNVIGGNGQYGLNLWAGLNHIYGNSFVAGNNAIDLYMAYEAGNVVVGNTFDRATTASSSKQHAIKIEYAANVGGVIADNDFNNQGSPSYSIIYVVGSPNWNVHGNTFRGSSVPKYFIEISNALNFTQYGNTYESSYTAGVFGWSGTCTGLKAGNSYLYAGGDLNDLATSGTEYFPIGAIASGNADATGRRLIVAKDGYLTNFCGLLSAAPGTGDARNITVSINGVDSALFIEFGASDTIGVDTDVVAVSQGDTIVVKSTVTGTPAASKCYVTCDLFAVDE